VCIKEGKDFIPTENNCGLPQEVGQESEVVHLLVGQSTMCNIQSDLTESQTLYLRCSKHHRLQ